MKLDLEKEETLMAEATKVVYQRRHLLHSKLLECSNTDNVRQLDLKRVMGQLSFQACDACMGMRFNFCCIGERC